METDSKDQNLSGHLIVCGFGHVGFRIVSLLEQLGEKAVVLTLENGDECYLDNGPRVPVIMGDARNESLLRKAGINSAKGIFAVTNDDMANVSIALDAARINPAIAIVIRLFDQELAGHLERTININRALSASALAAPGFVAAALNARVSETWDINGTACLLEELRAKDAQWEGHTIQQWSAKSGRAVLVHQRGDAQTFMPSCSLVLESGDRLMTLALAQESQERKPEKKAVIKNHRGFSPFHALVFGLREWWRETPVAIRSAMAAFLGVVLFSVVFFHMTLGLKGIDAFYFVITTITTVGYGDLSLINASPWLKLYGSFLMLCGAAIMATLFSIITDLVLRTRLRDVLARSCSRYKGHVIVAGLDNLGFRLVRELAEHGETVVAIDNREHNEFLKAAREVGAVVLGNARTAETLRKAGIMGAKAIIAATDNDLDNLSIGLAAKRAHQHCRVALRVFDSSLAAKLRNSLGVDEVLSLSATAAPAFVGAALCKGAHQSLLLPDGLAVIFSRKIETCQVATALDQNEFALFVKQNNTDIYQQAAQVTVMRTGDEIIGVRWFPFKRGQI